MKTKINNNEGKSRDSIVKCMQLANTISMKTFNESHTTSHKDIIEKSKTSRIPLFEFTNKVPSQSDAKFMFKENIKKGHKKSSKNRDHIHTDGIKLSRNPSFPKSISYHLPPDCDESESLMSENTAIHILPQPSISACIKTQHTVSIEDFNKVAMQVNEMKSMIANLTQTVQLLTAEVKRNSLGNQCQNCKGNK